MKITSVYVNHERRTSVLEARDDSGQRLCCEFSPRALQDLVRAAIGEAPQPLALSTTLSLFAGADLVKEWRTKAIEVVQERASYAMHGVEIPGKAAEALLDFREVTL